MAARFSCKRLLLCLPRRQPLDSWLNATSAFVRALPGCDIEVVAAPQHRLHDLNRDLVPHCLGRAADAIHLVPSPHRVVGFAADCTDSSTLLVTCSAGARQVPWRLRGSTLIVPAEAPGTSVLALVDPTRDAIGVVTTAIDFAHRLSLKRVVACRIFFNEGVLRFDDALDRVMGQERERLDIFMARVPATQDVAVSSRVSHAPDLVRATTRIAGEEDAALVVSAERLRLQLPTLALAQTVARQRQSPSGLAALLDTVFGSAPLQA